MNKRKKLCVIPPLPQNLIIAGILITLSLLTFNVRSPIEYQYYWSEFHLIISAIVLISTSFNYALYEDKLVLRMLFIPIKRIALEKVTSATYFFPNSVKLGKYTEDYASILLTLSPCPPFDGPDEDVSQFEHTHMLQTIRIKISGKKAQVIRDAVSICLSNFGITMNG